MFIVILFLPHLVLGLGPFEAYYVKFVMNPRVLTLVDMICRSLKRVKCQLKCLPRHLTTL